MKHFAYVLFVGFDAQRNFCDKQNVLFYGTPRTYSRFFSHSAFISRFSCRVSFFSFVLGALRAILKISQTQE